MLRVGVGGVRVLDISLLLGGLRQEVCSSGILCQDSSGDVVVMGRQGGRMVIRQLV